MYRNEYYDLSYDPAKNQINWKVKGFWRSPDVVPDVEKHWDAILARAEKPGFTILADMTEMKAAPPEVEAIHRRIQQKTMALGVRKVATIVSQSVIAGLAGKRVGRELGYDQVARNFNDRAKAQAWLDES